MSGSSAVHSIAGVITEQCNTKQRRAEHIRTEQNTAEDAPSRQEGASRKFRHAVDRRRNSWPIPALAFAVAFVIRKATGFLQEALALLTRVFDFLRYRCSLTV